MIQVTPSAEDEVEELILLCSSVERCTQLMPPSEIDLDEGWISFLLWLEIPGILNYDKDSRKILRDFRDSEKILRDFQVILKILMRFLRFLLDY